MAFIKIIEHSDSEGELKEIYDNLIKSRGKLARIHQIQSLNPASIRNHMDLYMTIMFGSSPLKRYQRELIGVIVSKCNHCDYCVQHHSEALGHFWKDERKLNSVIENFEDSDVSGADKALCAYARQLTLSPNSIDQAFHDQVLRSQGFDDRAILDASLVAAYFNFVNRLVLGLGVELEADEGKGYRYD
jgi:uncharacterized peroxidase-related enzyme